MSMTSFPVKRMALPPQGHLLDFRPRGRLQATATPALPQGSGEIVFTSPLAVPSLPSARPPAFAPHHAPGSTPPR